MGTLSAITYSIEHPSKEIFFAGYLMVLSELLLYGKNLQLGNEQLLPLTTRTIILSF